MMTSKVQSSLIFFFALSVSACNGWNSSLTTAQISDVSKSNKPICAFDSVNNCWSQSVKLLNNCFMGDGPSPTLQTDDLIKFENKDNQEVIFFKNSLEQHLYFNNKSLHFIAYNGKKPCFEFVGDEQNFQLSSKDHGLLSVVQQANGDTQVNCFFGESFIIPKEARQFGCRGQKDLGDHLVPRALLKSHQSKSSSGEMSYDHFQFSFFGAGVLSQPLFQCEL